MSSDRDIFDRYLLALRKTALDDKTEHTDRSALETLLQALANEAHKGVKVQHEPKRIINKGAPDFKITKGGLILGYVENKVIGEPLDKVLKSEQITKYKSLSQNIIVTDYLHFAWISEDGIQRESLCHETDIENKKFSLREDRIEAVRKLLHGFFSTAPEGIGGAQQLALALATRSKLLRDYLGEELVRQQKEHTEGRLYGLFDVFRQQIFHELTLKEFADAFAQMLAYGLFLARLNSDSKVVTLHNAREYVLGSFRLIRELVDFLSELEKEEYRDVRWVVEEVLSIVNGLNLTAIHEDLSFRQRKAISRKIRAGDEEEHRLFERDPFIYFYEDYLKAYDKETRKSRGVYYTPPPIVNFIIRAVDDILKENFNIADGLANHNRVAAKNWGAIGSDTYDGASVTARPTELNYFRRGGEYIFPIYMLAEGGSTATSQKVESFGTEFRNFIDARYEYHYTPEEILGCIYAVLHSPSFQTRFTEFLRADFPRIPFPDSADDFEALSEFGWELVDAHLLRNIPSKGLASYPMKGDHVVDAVRYSPSEQSVSINKTQFFKPVPQAVWDFHIGGYRVLEKYLKSRKGRKLTLDEINHVAAVADSLAFTIEQVAKIDRAYKRAFGQRG